MLEGLDTINWEDYPGAYGGHEELPKMILALLSEDETVRQEASSFISGELSHQGTIFPAASVTIPFLLEILASAQCPDPYAILDRFDQLIGDIRENLKVDDLLNYGEHYLDFHCFQAIAAGYPIYRLYLNYESTKVRSLAIKLLVMRSQNAANIRVSLRRQLKMEKAPLIRAIILKELIRFTKFGCDGHWEGCLATAYRAIFVQHLGGEQQRLIRLVAASSFNPNYCDAQLTKKVLDILFDAVKMPVNPQDFSDFVLEGDELECTEPYAVLEKIATFNLSFVAPRLNDKSLSPLQVHYIWRELLDREFVRINRDALYHTPFFRWGRLNGWVASFAHPPHRTNPQNPPPVYSVEQLDYKASQEFFPGKVLSRKEKELLKALLDCDAFWEIKSNLFSYVYALPDEREELRKLLD